ncbi:MAG: DNA repair protein RecN [Actinomycetes bacterium]
MIASLSLAGLGVIDAADLELEPGLTVLTGETGAGKTMVVTSLQLLLGQRASSDLVRSGSPRAQVTAHLTVDVDGSIATRVREAGGSLDDDTLTAVRTIAAQGRSRAALGGAAVPVGLLGEVAAELIAIHGQHEQGRLTDPVHQRNLVDRFGGLAASVAKVSSGHTALVALHAERAELQGDEQSRLRAADALRFGLAEIRAVAPVAGEDAALRSQEERLAHAVELKQAALGATNALAEDDRSVTDQIGELQRLMDAVREHDAELDALAARLSEIGYLLADVTSDLNSYAASVDADPARLAELQERRAALGPLLRKYGPELHQVLAWAEDADVQLAQVVGTDQRLANLDAEIEQTTATWFADAAELSNSRSSAATALSREVSGELAALAMPDAEFVVEVRRGDSPAAFGLDQVAFLLRPHRGGELLPVQRGASGGELSRIMLGLEVVLAGMSPVATLVFDEVDAGVGGSAAVEVGRRLGKLGQHRQVLVVTHLPQVAAFADHHWVVQKSTAGDVTASDLRRVEGDDRVKELTRMLAGLAESSSGRAHAEELLAVARTTK